MASSPICLLSKASKTKSWLWHRRLSYLNFGAINHLTRHDLVRGLPKLKFEKDHLCFACAMRKSKKKCHKPKSEDTNQEKLYLLHMDLCGPMRVASVNEKKYILVIVNFDELTTMASEHNSSGPALHEMTPTTISSGLVLNPPPSKPFIPPSKLLGSSCFNRCIDELLQSSPQVLIAPERSKEFSKGTVDPTLFFRRQGKDILLTPDSPVSKMNNTKYNLMVSNYWETDLLAGHQKGRKALRYPVRKLNI
ncbi:retrovirus-related pol polyprotein from transposon TNT 1-94 [Tanacetum coccineum]